MALHKRYRSLLIAGFSSAGSAAGCRLQQHAARHHEKAAVRKMEHGQNLRGIPIGPAAVCRGRLRQVPQDAGRGDGAGRAARRAGNAGRQSGHRKGLAGNRRRSSQGIHCDSARPIPNPTTSWASSISAGRRWMMAAGLLPAGLGPQDHRGPVYAGRHRNEDHHGRRG